MLSRWLATLLVACGPAAVHAEPRGNVTVYEVRSCAISHAPDLGLQASPAVPRVRPLAVQDRFRRRGHPVGGRG